MGLPGVERGVEALKPFLPWGPPTDEFRLYTGPISFVPTDGDALPSAPGHVDLLLRAGSHLNWSVDLHSLDGPVRRAWEREVQARATGEITFDLHGCPTSLPAHVLSEGRGFSQGGSPAAPGARIDRLVAHWLNLPGVRPRTLISRDEEGGTRIEWHGRRVIETPPWQLTLDARSDHDDVYRDAKRGYLSALTHTMMLRRQDGELFSTEEAEQILGDVHLGLSFPLGRWAAPILPIGLAADGTPIASFWGAWHADTPGIDADRWWPEHRSEFLDDYLTKLISLSEDPTERGHLNFLITSSLATSQKAYLEQRLSTGLAAIEYLSWIDEVLSGQVSEHDWRYKRNSAAKRIRRRLINASVPLVIDAELSPELAAFAKHDNADGPIAVALVRDAVTHPKERETIYGVGSPLADAARLSSRYLDLLSCIVSGIAGRLGTAPRSPGGTASASEFHGRPRIDLPHRAGHSPPSNRWCYQQYRTNPTSPPRGVLAEERVWFLHRYSRGTTHAGPQRSSQLRNGVHQMPRADATDEMATNLSTARAALVLSPLLFITFTPFLAVLQLLRLAAVHLLQHLGVVEAVPLTSTNAEREALAQSGDQQRCSAAPCAQDGRPNTNTAIPRRGRAHSASADGTTQQVRWIENDSDSAWDSGVLATRGSRNCQSDSRRASLCGNPHGDLLPTERSRWTCRSAGHPNHHAD